MIVVNLEKYAEENYYKQPANSPGAASPDNVTHARLYYDDFAGVNFLQGSFVSDNNSTVEFDNSGISDTVFKLFVSTDGTTYTERKSYGGTSGADAFSSAMVLNPADYDDYDIPVKNTVSTVEQFVPMSLTEIIEAGTLSMNDYYFLRGKLYQDNSLYSGRPFFGVVSVNLETGALAGSSLTYYANSTNNLVNTVSDYISRSGSAKISTGIYSLQCTMGATSGASTNGMRTELASSAFKYKFENSVFPVYGGRTIGFTSFNPRAITHIQRFSSTHIRIKVTGFAGTDYSYYTEYVGTNLYIRDLVCDILENPDGAYEVSSVDTSTGYVDLLCNTVSGTATFAVATGTLSEGEVYSETYVPGLVGYVVLDVYHEAQTYYDTGKLIIKTYNTSDVLTDDILTYGCTLAFKAQKISY